MEVTQSSGPTVNQNNIPAAGATINNISITATKNGAALLLARARFVTGTALEVVLITIQRNGVTIPGSGTAAQLPAASGDVTPVAFVGITDMAIGDIFTIYAAASFSTADIQAIFAVLTLVTA